MVHLSPSGFNTFCQCRRRWRFRYVDGLPDPPGVAALVGTFAHSVLELLFAPDVEPADRSKVLAWELFERLWPDLVLSEDFVALGLDEGEVDDFVEKAWQSVKGLWALEDPSKVVVVSTEQRVSTVLAGVPFVGVVDRVESASSGIVVSDYKSGRAPPPRFAGDRLRQVLLYAAAIASLGERPVEARLLYLGTKTVSTAVTDELLIAILSALADCWVAIDECLASGRFEPSPGPLCGWCPYTDRCPEGQAEIRRREG